MKVLHIATIDIGGAYKAAERFHKSLLENGVDSRILVRTSILQGEARECFNGFMGRIMSKGKNAINLMLSQGEIFRDVLGTDISAHQWVQEADVLVLHWINSFLSVKSLDRLLKLGKPVVFMMHDMWLFTGGCHVAGECRRYEQGCGCCPLIPSAKEKDISFLNFLDKKKLFAEYQPVITGPSSWIVECAGKSSVFSDQRIIYMPNMIDTKIFKPLPLATDKEALRQKYGIPEGKKIILFGAADSGTGNKNKGFVYLSKALQELDPRQYHLAVFGESKDALDLPVGFESTLLGYIQSEEQMAEVYNLAHVYVTPSLQESFGFTVCEAMACGVPVTAFPVGGILDQITHKENGYLAELKDPADLAAGIRFCAENGEWLGAAAVVAAQRFSFETVGERYEAFLREICKVS